MKDTLYFQVMIYLAAALLMVPIAKKIGLGPVLGYLLGGVLIGPDVLNLIGKRGQRMMDFGEFGVVMMLFIIGLELNPLKLWNLRKSILGLGAVQVLATSFALAGLGVILHLDWRQSIALGLILSMSSTAIVLQIFQERHLMEETAGRQGFAVLLFQDISVIPILAIFPLLAAGSAQTDVANHTIIGSLPAGFQSLAVLGSVAFVIIAGKFIMPPLFRIIARTDLREMFTAAALFIVIGIAVLMTAVGLSPALGTFLAGVILANSEFRHELESDIDPFKALFLGLFFLAVGASIDFHLVLAKPVLIFGLVAVIMIVKLGVLAILGKSARMPKAQNFIFSFALCQVGEFAFVLLNFSSQKGIFTLGFTQVLIATVAISMALTPLVMLLYFKVIQRLLISKRETGTAIESDLQPQENPVIIAGYGHFGTTIGRFLRSNKVEATVLDSDADLVNRLRRMGFSVFYGDATRHQLLEIAGAKKAKVMIITIPDPLKRMEIVDLVKKHFPHLILFVRATNRYDAYDLIHAGVDKVYRQSFDTSLRAGAEVLGTLGFNDIQIKMAARYFAEKDEASLKVLGDISNDDEYVEAIRKYSAELDQEIQKLNIP